MSTEERLSVVENVVSALVDRIDLLTTSIEIMGAQIEKLKKELKEKEDEDENRHDDKFNMTPDASRSLFEKMFPKAVTSSNEMAAAASTVGTRVECEESDMFDRMRKCQSSQQEKRPPIRQANILNK